MDLFRDRLRIPLWFWLAAILLVFGLTACTETATDTADGPDDPELDSVCSAALDLTFESEESVFLGESQGGSFYAPVLVSFFSDGRVLWRYTPEAVFGTFTCNDGVFEAEFSEGERTSFRGTYNPETMELAIDEMKFNIATDI